MPKHKKIQSTEREQLLNIVTPQQLQKIKQSDIVSRWMDFDKNDIIKITRKNGYVGYRIVI